MDERTQILSEERRRSSDVHFTPGTIVGGRYRIVALLGGGGMGQVYRADDLRLGQPVALKYVSPQLAADPLAIERLYAEVRIGRQVSHPNVCRLYDLIELEGHRFIAMEYVDGEDLASLLRRIGRLPTDKALALTRDLCAGLAAAHDRGFIHCDLKPANIMIDGRGVARITDFGLAAIEEEMQSKREIAGTPAYMAPEQSACGVATARSDLYALGLVLYEMFTGKHYRATQTRPSSLVDIDPSVERVILRCLDEDPEERPSSIHAVIGALPGGDALQAAVARGETPSPEMVAAADQIGDLAAGAAWTMLAALGAALIALTLLSDRLSLTSRTTRIRSRDALADRARDILAMTGIRAEGDAAASFETRGNLILFRYRHSPAPLVPENYRSIVRPDDPPEIVPGMATIILDHEGRLREYRRVPPLITSNVGAAHADWEPLFRQAGLDPARFRSTSPEWAPPHGSDARRAWIGDGVRVEAAGLGSMPVYFSVLAPQPAPGIEPGEHAFSLIVIATLIGAGCFARHNVARGRADLRAAARVSAVVAVTMVAARIAVMHHQLASPGAEWTLLVVILSDMLFVAAITWIFYLAVEPYVRRRWPHILIGWTRAVSGRLRDALVGREILEGLLLGAAGAAASFAFSVAVSGPPRGSLSNPAFSAPLGLPAALLLAVSFAVNYAFGLLAVLVLLRLALRRDWYALAALVLVAALAGLGGSNPLIGYVEQLLIAAAAALALRRGALAATAQMFVYHVAIWAPLTFDFTQWFSARSAIALLTIAALGVYGFYTAVAGKPLFGAGTAERVLTPT